MVLRRSEAGLRVITTSNFGANQGSASPRLAVHRLTECPIVDREGGVCVLDKLGGGEDGVVGRCDHVVIVRGKDGRREAVLLRIPGLRRVGLLDNARKPRVGTLGHKWPH